MLGTGAGGEERGGAGAGEDGRDDCGSSVLDFGLLDFFGSSTRRGCALLVGRGDLERGEGEVAEGRALAFQSVSWEQGFVSLLGKMTYRLEDILLGFCRFSDKGVCRSWLLRIW